MILPRMRQLNIPPMGSVDPWWPGPEGSNAVAGSRSSIGTRKMAAACPRTDSPVGAMAYGHGYNSLAVDYVDIRLQEKPAR